MSCKFKYRIVEFLDEAYLGFKVMYDEDFIDLFYVCSYSERLFKNGLH